MTIHRDDMAALVDARDAIGQAGDTYEADSVHYLLGAAIHDLEQASDELITVFRDSVHDFILEHVLVEGLSDKQRDTLDDWLADTMYEHAGRLNDARRALNAACDRAGDASDALTEAVANIERETWLASVGAA